MTGAPPDPPSAFAEGTSEQLDAAYDLAKESFSEVLDATKHQDDKIGRFLTAISFLTTGAIALLFGTRLTSSRISFHGAEYPGFGGHQDYPLLSWCAFTFFACILWAVILLLVSLTTPLRLPGLRPGRGFSLDQSRLFFTHIAYEPVDEWAARWSPKNSEKIKREMYGQYVNETHNLAVRARVKYGRTNEAGILFILALLALGLGITVALATLFPVGGSAPVTVPWDWKLASSCVVVISGHALIQLHALSREAATSRQLQRDALSASATRPDQKALQAVRSLRWLLLFVPLYIACVLLPGEQVWQRRCGAVGAIAVIVLAFSLMRSRWNAGPARDWPWMQIVLYSTVPAAAAILALAGGGLAQLGAALLPSLGLAVQSLRDQARHDRGRPPGTATAATPGPPAPGPAAQPPAAPASTAPAVTAQAKAPTTRPKGSKPRRPTTGRGPTSR